MSCYQSASAVVRSGTTGFVLVINAKTYSGYVGPATIEKGKLPFDPVNVFPVIIRDSVPQSPSPANLELTYNLQNEDEFEFIEIFCGDAKEGIRIEIEKEGSKTS